MLSAISSNMFLMGVTIQEFLGMNKSLKTPPDVPDVTIVGANDY
ncbi:MAG: hypothetical protein ACPL7I_08640 [Myxococcota bacterium]